MLENITHREWVDKYEYSHHFSWNDCPGAGFSFDCLEDGEGFIEVRVGFINVFYVPAKDRLDKAGDRKSVV